ncbi:MAG: NAD(P)H-binding protein [Capsulimonadales bacterium]|nr:NAD(P)H-binding protein [Capsulimonadales bacterium]
MAKIVVTTPTGNIGHVVTDRLLDAGAEVTVIARNPSKLKESVRQRARVVTGDQFDPAVTREASKGADALFWLTPPTFDTPDWRAYFERSAEVATEAVRTNGIPYVVHLSSGGADRPTGYGPVSFLHPVERSLAATGANVLQLRPGYFYENFLASLPTIRDMGTIYGVPKPETVYPMIATRDIGEAAARQLLALDWKGERILGLHGPADTPSFGEAARILGEAIGKPVQYVQVPTSALQDQLRGMGASESVAVSYGELFEALDRGEQPAEPRTPETTTPTRLYDWAREVLAPLIQTPLSGS